MSVDQVAAMIRAVAVWLSVLRWVWLAARTRIEEMAASRCKGTGPAYPLATGFAGPGDFAGLTQESQVAHQGEPTNLDFLSGAINAAPAVQGVNFDFGPNNMTATQGVGYLAGGPAGYGYGAGWGANTGVGPGNAFGGNPDATAGALGGGFGSYGAGGVGIGLGPDNAGTGFAGNLGLASTGLAATQGLENVDDLTNTTTEALNMTATPGVDFLGGGPAGYGFGAGWGADTGIGPGNAFGGNPSAAPGAMGFAPSAYGPEQGGFAPGTYGPADAGMNFGPSGDQRMADYQAGRPISSAI